MHGWRREGAWPLPSAKSCWKPSASCVTNLLRFSDDRGCLERERFSKISSPASEVFWSALGPWMLKVMQSYINSPLLPWSLEIHRAGAATGLSGGILLSGLDAPWCCLYGRLELLGFADCLSDRLISDPMLSLILCPILPPVTLSVISEDKGENKVLHLRGLHVSSWLPTFGNRRAWLQ